MKHAKFALLALLACGDSAAKEADGTLEAFVTERAQKE